jgi:geranylgeranyl diphosphate synthase type II
LNPSLDEYFRSRRPLVEQALEGHLRPQEGLPESLREAMRYSLLAPGKRLRPMLVLLACEACGGKEKDALPAACAVEMVHTYSLIHDDLPAMDNDDLRRGLPTCHRKFGEALAILAGDALLTMAFEVLAEGLPGAIAAACCRELAKGAGAAGMVGGQVDDLAHERRLVREGSQERPPLGGSGETSQMLEDLQFLHARKTGALFRASLKMGVLAAQGGPERLGLFDEYGRCFGQAFQITDDLLDVEGSAEQTGKRVQKDADRGKLTYPGLLGIAESRRRAAWLCEEACRHLAPLGAAGERLAQFAHYLIHRDR